MCDAGGARFDSSWAHSSWRTRSCGHLRLSHTQRAVCSNHTPVTDRKEVVTRASRSGGQRGHHIRRVAQSGQRERFGTPTSIAQWRVRSSVEREFSGSFLLRGAPGLLVQLARHPSLKREGAGSIPAQATARAGEVRQFSLATTLAFVGPTVEGYQERADRKVMQVRVLPLLHTRDRNLMGDEAHGEHDNTHYHTLPHTGADGCGLSPVKRRGPGSSPGILHHSWAGVIGLPLTTDPDHTN